MAFKRVHLYKEFFLLSNIDHGMAQMKDHPGQGGLPAPPAAAIQGTTQAPYAAAAPPADPNGAAELDQQAQQGAQLEQQVVAEATAPDASGASAVAPAHTGPVTIALGQTPAEVIASKGQPSNKVDFPTKTVFIYPDVKNLPGYENHFRSRQGERRAITGLPMCLRAERPATPVFPFLGEDCADVEAGPFSTNNSLTIVRQRIIVQCSSRPINSAMSVNQS